MRRVALNRGLPWLVLIPALWLVGCSGDRDGMKKRIAELTDDVQRLQSGQDRVEERLAAVELQSMQRAAQRASKRAKPASDHPDLKVVRVAPGDEPPPPDLDDAAGPDSDAIALPGPEDDLDDAPRPVIRGVGDHFETSTTGGGDARDDATRREYKAALGLVRGRQFKEASVSLAKFVREHPKSKLSDNAVYWAGECQYALGHYDEAAKQFRDLVKRYPKGNKVPDALLKLGMCLARMGHADDARASFARLSQNYPDAAAARRIPQGY